MPDTLDFTVILEPQPDGGYTVRVPSLPEVATEGDTEAEALAMPQEAIRLVQDHCRNHGSAISEDMPSTLRKVTIAA